MAGHHHHHHGPDPARAEDRRRLQGALVLALSYLGAEVVGGLWTGSLALLADAGHMASDAAALALALGAFWLAQRPATAEKTFGWHRAEILAALLNGAALVGVAVMVFTEALERFSAPPEVKGLELLGIATGGLVVNLIAFKLLHGSESENLNLKGAALHVAADALGSVGAIVSGAVIWAFDWRWADPAASILIGVLVLVSAVSLLKGTVDILMQGTPAHLDIHDVKKRLEEHDGVASVHDMHAWTLTSGRDLLSAHAVLAPGASAPDVLGALQQLLHDEFELHHVTLQLEPSGWTDCAGCSFSDPAPDDAPAAR